MIKLHKTAIPAVLLANAANWTKIVLDKLAAGEELTKADKARYSHKDIKAAIVAETHGKCAYCESQIRHIAPGDIEHITPKRMEPAKWFEWSNLTLACDNCNTKKGVSVDVVDPYEGDPEARFIFFGPGVYPLPGDDAAFLTIRYLDFNRSELVGRRTERIEYLMALAKNIANARNPEIKKILKEDFRQELESKCEYAALCRAIARGLEHTGTL